MEPKENLNEIGQYKAGLGKHAEAVVSAHFMHEQNLSGAALYSAEKFASEAMFITPDEVRAKLIPQLKAASEEVVEKRSKAAIERARRNYKLYGLADSAKIGAAECITEVLFDDWFKRGSVSQQDRLQFRDHVKSLVEHHKPIELAVPMMPNKISCPLKSRGVLPCMAEAGLLARLGEITGTIGKIYHDQVPQTSGRNMAKFIVVGDGHRFKAQFNTSDDVIVNYQKALRCWTHYLGINDSVTVVDFEELLNKSLTAEQKAHRSKYYETARAMLNAKLGKVLDPYNVEASLQEAIRIDPYPEEVNPEGRFVPLFKSMIYNIDYKILRSISASEKLNCEDHARMYREMTKHMFQPFAQFTEADSDRVYHSMMGHKTDAPSTKSEVKEYIRRSMLAEAWQSTIDYLALVIADRELAQDPVCHALPAAIRYSIHAKPGQIALVADSSCSSPVQPWQGSGVLRPSGNKIKLSNASALDLEGSGAKPLLVRHSKSSNSKSPAPPPSNFYMNDKNILIAESNTTTDSIKALTSDDIIEQFAQSDQPIVYIHPDVKFYAEGEVCRQQVKKITHCRG